MKQVAMVISPFNIARCVIVICLSVLISSCSLIPWQPTKKMTLHIAASHFLNPNQLGDACPVQVTIYQLQKPARFKHAEYLSLIQQPQAQLQDDLVDKVTYRIKPGERRDIPLMLDQSTHYIAIAAGFRVPLGDAWRVVLPIPIVRAALATLRMTIRLHPTALQHQDAI